MKQNERWLVYAVSGFLSLILVVAVVFRPKSGAGNAAMTPGLAQILNQEVAVRDADAPKPAADDKTAADASLPGVPSPSDVAPQPLSAPAPKPMVAADLVAQQLGMSHRDRNVRFVRAKPNDSVEGLVRRWCGARDPYLAETKSLNEELVVLRVGQEIAVPWVDDEVLVAAIEASKPKALTAELPATPGAAPANGQAAPSFATPAPAAITSENNITNENKAPSAGSSSGVAIAVAAGTSYTVKAGDSLWRIAERTYGRKNANKMVAAIKQANPGLGDGVREGQKLVLPQEPKAN
ncbi:MAG: LysM peptidoglycan-binding domain-containing protein [Planctomycetes bacterium]|nr:LysM peptidoglycan-binding domain-containing protein [Planctomycetota bacterium]